MTLKFIFFYQNANADYFLKILQNTAESCDLAHFDTTLAEHLLFFVNGSQDAAERFADEIGAAMPLSLYFHLKGVEVASAAPRHSSTPKLSSDFPFDLREMLEIKNANSPHFCDIFDYPRQKISAKIFAFGEAVADKIALQNALETAASRLKNGESLRFSTIKGEIILSCNGAENSADAALQDSLEDSLEKSGESHGGESIESERGESSEKSPATPANPSANFDFILANDISSVSLCARANKAELDALGAFEKPLVRLQLKEIFAAEFGAQNAAFVLPYDPILAALASILSRLEVAFLFARFSGAQKNKGAESSQKNRPNPASSAIFYEPRFADRFFEIVVAENGLFLEKRYLGVRDLAGLDSRGAKDSLDSQDSQSPQKSLDSQDSSGETPPFKAAKNAPSAKNARDSLRGFLDISLLLPRQKTPDSPREDSPKISPQNSSKDSKFCVYLSSHFPSKFCVLNAQNRPTHAVVGVIFDANVKNLLSALSHRENGKKLLENYRKNFAENLAFIENLSPTPMMSQNLLDIFGALSAVLFSSQNPAKILESAAKALRDSGPIIDFKLVNPSENAAALNLAATATNAPNLATLTALNPATNLKAAPPAPKNHAPNSTQSPPPNAAYNPAQNPTPPSLYDPLPTLSSVLSFRLAGVEEELICYGVLESLAEFVTRIMRDVALDFGLKNAAICGDLFGEKIFFAKICASFPRDLGLIFPQFLDFGDKFVG